ncbi:hypothetical protein RRG08_043934 [Elysia crispata]|uniref:Secreted protein n=1 Tax=Elysia crispata TaxID=231223 RepID=A0AAE0Y186_9GAST|nr:hypothetical protein RRG08_043934 [Elysia crispata]
MSLVFRLIGSALSAACQDQAVSSDLISSLFKATLIPATGCQHGVYPPLPWRQEWSPGCYTDPLGGRSLVGMISAEKSHSLNSPIIWVLDLIN